MLEDKNHQEIKDMIDDAVCENNIMKLACISKELLGQVQWLSSIKISNEKLIGVLDETNVKYKKALTEIKEYNEYYSGGIADKALTE